MGPIIDLYEGFPIFIKHSLDDVVEDLLKYSSLAVMHFKLFVPFAGIIFGPQNFFVMHTLAFVGTSIAFFPVNIISDYIADKVVDPLKPDILASLGYEDKITVDIKEHCKVETNIIVDSLEDYIEDVVKFTCLATNYMILGQVNQMVQSHISHYPAGRQVGYFADATIQYGPLLVQYNQCDYYSGQIGDMFQNQFSQVDYEEQNCMTKIENYEN